MDAIGLALVVAVQRIHQEPVLHTILMEDAKLMTSVGSSVQPSARRTEIEDVLGMESHVLKCLFLIMNTLLVLLRKPMVF